MPDTPDDSLAFNVLLNVLFEHIRDRDNRVYTDVTVSNATGMSQSSISALRRGVTTNPRLNNVKALCHFFEVPLGYFGATSEQEAINIILQSHRKQSPDAGLATRLTHLSDEARHDLERILAWVQKADTRSDEET